MNKSSFSISDLRRQRSRFIIYIDLVFVLVPFIFLAFKKITIDLLVKPEWALAASILFGQATARMICGMLKHRVDYWHRGALYAVLLMIASLCSVYHYSIVQDPQGATITHYVLQWILFILSIFCFILFGAVGQHLLDVPEKEQRQKKKKYRQIERISPDKKMSSFMTMAQSTACGGNNL